MIDPHDRYWPNNKNVRNFLLIAQSVAIGPVEFWAMTESKGMAGGSRIHDEFAYCLYSSSEQPAGPGSLEPAADAEHRTIRGFHGGALMLRKGLVALMMGVICAGSAMAEDSATKRPNPAPTGLVGWLKKKTSALRHEKSSSNSAASTGKVQPKPKPTNGGIERAVVNDAERQAIRIRQASGSPQDAAPAEPTVTAVEKPLQPVPIQQAPVLPNTSSLSGPQYFSATPSGMSNPLPVYPSNNWQTYQSPTPVYMNSPGQFWNASSSHSAGPVYHGHAPMHVHSGAAYSQGGNMYPQTGAALYPCPIPGIPQQIGGTAVMNPAFHPHEMLHAHRYKAMYPPYYYKVHGGWMVTPFGVWSHEDWKLKGTQVDVKYKSHISPLSLFHPPVIH